MTLPQKDQYMGAYWSIERAALVEFQNSMRQLSLKMMDNPTPEAVIPTDDDDAAPSILTRSGKTAVISISGPLLRRPIAWARRWGIAHTGYSEIIESLAIAEQDEAIEDIQLHIDSPGGTILGLHRAMQAVADTEKPVIAFVPDLAASAAYGGSYLVPSASLLALVHAFSSALSNRPINSSIGSNPVQIRTRFRLTPHDSAHGSSP